jgi:hypothetical protein
MNAAFRRFAQERYKINYWADLQRDTARKKPLVSAGLIFKALVHQAPLGLRSLLELDQKGRTQGLRDLLGSSREIAGGSDSTILRALGRWVMGPTIETLYGNHIRLRHQGLAKTVLSTGRKVLLAICDGSSFGGFDFSVLAVAGGVPHVLDMQASPGRGHELKVSRELMKRAAIRLGKGFATHLLYDGLMAVKADFWRARHYWGTHLVVKTSEESLEIVQSSKEAWSVLSQRDLERAGVEVVSGLDGKRSLRYEAYAQAGVPWVGSSLKFNVAWVKETHLKGKDKGQSVEFCVLTTDQTLSASELREIAHSRWSIENHQFKETNEQVGSKKAYIKNPRVKEALLRMLFLGMALLKEFKAHLETLPQWINLTAKKTKKLIAQVILFGFPCQAPMEHPPP